MSQTNAGFQLIHELVKHRWIPEILDSIAKGNQGYTQILKDHDYLSKTELNRKLALLVDKKVVEKEVHDNKSLYKLLDLGEDLDHIFKHFEDIGRKYM